MSLAAAATTRALWYATRGTGVISLVLLTAVVWLGVAGVRRFRTDRWPRFLVVGLHRNLTLLTLAFLGAHVATTVLDAYTPIGPKDALIPFASSYRPLWLGLGAIAFDLLLALTITSLARARVGVRAWRLLHWLAYASWPVALVHALGTGSDARVRWLQALAAAAVLAVVAAVLVRVRSSGANARAVSMAAVALAVLAGAVWYRTGPDRRGWAARAGTPKTLLAAAVRAPAARENARQATIPPSRPFAATLAGHISTTSDRASGRVLVSIRARTSGAPHGRLWIRLQGEPLAGGGVSMTASGASFGTADVPEQYLGTIVSLDGTRLGLALRDDRGRTMSLLVDLRLSEGSDAVSGTVRARPGGAS
jgi:sulfoxide reductase heme-binding subunit YedZ